MSPSPKVAGSADQFAAYRDAWLQITAQTRAGKSFSGRERHCCYLNTGGLRMANVSSTSGFDFADDGRGLALVDWDQDGDLDVWVSNRTAPQLRFLRNESPTGRHFLGLTLRGAKSNRDAIGARVEVEFADGSPRRLVRTVRAGGGFLSQASKQLHFGLGDRAEIARVTVRWPGGTSEEVHGVSADGHYEIVEGSGAARKLQRPVRGRQLQPEVVDALPADHGTRVVLGRRAPMPRYLMYQSLGGVPLRLDDPIDRPRLVLLWSTSCRSCLAEMRELADDLEQAAGGEMELLALNVDALRTSDVLAEQIQIAATLERLAWPHEAGIASPAVMKSLAEAHDAFVLRRGPLVLPSSYLFDENGQLAVIYEGRVRREQLVDDLKILKLSPAGIFQAACPFPGRWNAVVPQTATRHPRKTAPR